MVSRFRLVLGGVPLMFAGCFNPTELVPRTDDDSSSSDAGGDGSTSTAVTPIVETTTSTATGPADDGGRGPEGDPDGMNDDGMQGGDTDEGGKSGPGPGSSGSPIVTPGESSSGGTWECLYYDECGVCEGPGGPCYGCIHPAASNYDPYAYVDDGSCECDPQGLPRPDQAQTTWSTEHGDFTVWQEFVPVQDGGLVRIDVGIRSPNAPNPMQATLEILEGDGEFGYPIHSQTIMLGDVPPGDMQGFELSRPIVVGAFGLYSFRISVPEFTAPFVSVDEFDSYFDGRSSFDPTWDLMFRTSIVTCGPR